MIEGATHGFLEKSSRIWDESRTQNAREVAHEFRIMRAFASARLSCSSGIG